MWEKIEVIDITSPRKTGSKDDIQNDPWWAFNKRMQGLMMRKNGVNAITSNMEYNQRSQRKLLSITKGVLLKKMQDFARGTKNTTL